MSSIALIICSIFVLYMLMLDRKQSPEVSFAFWIPTFWFLVISSKPIAFWFQTTGATIEEGNPLDRVFLIVMFCLGVIMLVKRRFNWSSVIKENIWLILLLGFMLLGCIWANDSFISFKRWTRELIAIVMIAVVASEPHPLKALESLLRRAIYILIPLSYILIHYFSEYGRLYVHHSGDLMWVGASTHKNGLTQLCSYSIFFLIWTFIRRRQGRNIPATWYQTYLELVIILLALWIMGGPNHSFTYSATAALSGILGLVMLVSLFWYKKRGIIPGPAILSVLIAVIIVYGTITPFIGKLSIIDLSSTLGRGETLTGRATVWQQLVPVALQKPVLGQGFSSFWTTVNRKIFDIPTAHNGYLEFILNLGFVGLLLYSVFLSNSIRKAQKMMTQNFDWGIFWVCTMVMALASNITESSFVSFENRAMVVILCLMFVATTPTSNGTEVAPETIKLDNNK